MRKQNANNNNKFNLYSAYTIKKGFKRFTINKKFMYIPK